MSVTVQQLLDDAKKLVTRLKNHDKSADNLISQAQTLSNNVQTMQEYHKEVEKLNALAHQRPRSTLIMNIQQENRHIKNLQQENRELRTMLEEHQSALELIMTNYRQQVKKIAETVKAEQAWAQKDFSKEIQARTEKIKEMVAVMKKAVEVDDQNSPKEQALLNRLIAENRLLKDVLELNQIRSEEVKKRMVNRTDESVQTDL